MMTLSIPGSSLTLALTHCCSLSSLEIRKHTVPSHLAWPFLLPAVFGPSWKRMVHEDDSDGIICGGRVQAIAFSVVENGFCGTIWAEQRRAEKVSQAAQKHAQTRAGFAPRRTLNAPTITIADVRACGCALLSTSSANGRLGN